jgi:hypothetical protein
MTDGTARQGSVPADPPEARDLHELAALLAAGYVRLLGARGIEAAQLKRLDVADGNEAPLSQRTSRRHRRG